MILLWIHSGHSIFAPTPGKHRLATGREKSSFEECLEPWSDQCQTKFRPVSNCRRTPPVQSAGSSLLWRTHHLDQEACSRKASTDAGGREAQPRLNGSLSNSSPGCKHGLLDWGQLQLHHSPLSSYFCSFLEAWILWWRSWVSWEPDSFRPQAMC